MENKIKEIQESFTTQKTKYISVKREDVLWLIAEVERLNEKAKWLEMANKELNDFRNRK